MRTGRASLTGYLLAEGISLTGTRLSMIALPWLVLTTTGSAGRTGLVAFAEMAPLVVAKATSGPLIDRLGSRRVAVACDVASLFVVGLVPLLHTAGALDFVTLLVLVAVGGCLRGPGDSAKQAVVPALAEHAQVPLERVTGLSGAVERSASFLGAAVAAGLVAAVGATAALAVDAVSFGVCAAVFAAATSRLRVRALPEDCDEGNAGRASYLEDLRKGWDVVRHDRVLVALTVMVALTNLFDLAFSAVLLPVWARESGHGVGTVGGFFAVSAAASAIGALLAAWLGDRLPRFRVYVVAFLVAGLPRFLVLALGLPTAVVLGTAVAGGLMSGFLNPILGAVLYERIPRAVLGRVLALTSALCWSLIPFGGLLGGGLVGAVGVSGALLAVGCAYLLATMLPVVMPSFRSFDSAPARVGVAAGGW